MKINLLLHHLVTVTRYIRPVHNIKSENIVFIMLEQTFTFFFIYYNI